MEDLTNALDSSLLRDYERDLDLIESQKKSMESEVAAYRTAKASDPYYTNDALRRAIRDNLHKLYILLGCAVRLRMHPHDDIDLALAQFGFKLNHATHGPDLGDIKLVALAAVAATVTMIGLAAFALGQLALWPVSPVFPQTVFQPFLDAISTLIPHATAIMVADIMRRHAIDGGSWFSASGADRRPNAANYIRVAVVAGIAGYLALILWGLTQQAPTADSFKIEVPNMLLAMVTGGFYVYHLDNAELGTRPSVGWELGAQTVLTGLCGVIAACATWEIIFGAARIAADRIVLTGLINAAVGFVLAWYIPKAAAAANYDPMTSARDERLRTLATAARTRLGETAAAAWLDAPHAALGTQSPRALAAASVEGFERAWSLLQGPLAVAA
jgi:hypothetical protein